MNDSVIKNYATWARRELLEGVRQRCEIFGIAESGVPAPDAQAVGGRVLTERERAQRAGLLGDVAEDGLDRLVDKAAYTWFNRLVAIRFMEVNDRLPSHVRVLSAQDGGSRPQALDEAMDLPFASLDANEVVRLVQAGDDEALFRVVFLAQCDELADCMPGVFEHVGSAMELLLPDGLLRKEGLVDRLVSDIPEDDWREGVQIVGWMYQNYVSERKDEVYAGFKNGKKADRDAIAPATQLFTPDWIVRYLVENSLGRLWVLNHPDSSLLQSMKYFVKPDEDHEKDFRHIESPEDIRVIDPACGSGHLLVYAFDLLAQMYAEAGYSKRDAARLIVEKNLVGLEIDTRAGELASFSITMEAMQLDGRFLRRGVTPNITVLDRVTFTPEELALCPRVAARKKLIDAAAHLDECGSLFQPSHEDLDALAGDLASLAGAPSLFAARAADKLGRLREELAPLADTYDVVVANPPYMGSKNMGKWLASWVSDNYPDEKRDLFSSFIIRNLALGADGAQLGFMTPYVWMFISSYKQLRATLIGENTITSLIQLEYSGFAGATVPICTFTLEKGYVEGYKGGYVRLSDFVGPEQQAPRALEALADPDCGWFYRRNANSFCAIPGSPIAYWTGNALLAVFRQGIPLGDICDVRKGVTTSDNDRFLHFWWEVSHDKERFECRSVKESVESGAKWFPCNKGGEFRKWYGNNDYVINWENDGYEIRNFRDEHGKLLSVPRNTQYLFLPAVTWSDISSGAIAFRYKPAGHVFEGKGPSMFASNSKLAYLQGALNSSVIAAVAEVMSPTLNFNVGQVATYPVLLDAEHTDQIVSIVTNQRTLSQADWDSNEGSWDYKRHPLV